MINRDEVAPQYFWYFIGYLATDGNLSKDGRHINITSKDRGHLIAIKKLLHLRCKVGWKTRGGSKEKNYSQIQIGDVKFYKYLLDIGITPKKSLTLGEIAIDRRYFSDFLRGVTDGDGCINTWVHRTNGHRQWALRITSAAPIFAQWLKNEIENCFHVRGRIYTHKYKGKKNYINVLKFGKLAAKIIIQRSYYKGSFSLVRKNKIATLCLQDTNKMINYGNVLGPGAVIGSQNRLKIG